MIGAMTAGPLRFLDFDYSEDEHGHGSFDAMAAAAPAQLPALQTEIARVLDWAHAHFGAPSPLEEGGEWDYALHGVSEVATPLDVQHVPGAAQLLLRPGASQPPRVTLTLTLGGTPAFGEALRAAFALDAA
jgi:hypothetical protein